MSLDIVTPSPISRTKIAFVVLFHFSVLLMICYSMCHHGRRKGMAGKPWPQWKTFWKIP